MNVMQTRFRTAYRAMRKAKTAQDYFAPSGGMLHIQAGDCYRLFGHETHREVVLNMASAARRDRNLETARMWLDQAARAPKVRLP